MNFVKTHIYKQIYTNEGIQELEKDTRSKKELVENQILKGLPEFKRDNQFLSLSEQLELKKNTATLEDNDNNTNLYGLPSLTEEDLEYYENYEKNDNYSIEKLKERERELVNEFNEAIKGYIKKKRKKETDLDILKENVNLSEIKKSINKKKAVEFKPTVKAIIKTKKNKNTINSENKKINLKVSCENKKIETEENSLLFGYSDNSDN
ncbi:conserved Plasmodium protein, unknown function [Plasmodium gallinaceum]|uniref:Uncharacterized protein n=1 Tax=Plasmodium gallinaceum TaxID=5849 RepID=A0A1J1GSV3_PLAGA|nr:conserved Plasmodium protein, unknown function [Plasmodium gallinaceum]CRG94131.1 conserved Plasmodium protein, unknown function [Plasmodium gallinaceum]